MVAVVEDPARAQPETQAGVEELEQRAVLARLFGQPRQQAQQLVAAVGLAVKALQQSGAFRTPGRRVELLVAPGTEHVARGRDAGLVDACRARIRFETVHRRSQRAAQCGRVGGRRVPQAGHQCDEGERLGAQRTRGGRLVDAVRLAESRRCGRGAGPLHFAHPICSWRACASTRARGASVPTGQGQDGTPLRVLDFPERTEHRDGARVAAQLEGQLARFARAQVQALAHEHIRAEGRLVIVVEAVEARLLESARIAQHIDPQRQRGRHVACIGVQAALRLHEQLQVAFRPGQLPAPHRG